MSKPIQVIAHRGVSALYPENTMSAFGAAVDLGVDWIELDVVTTVDGTLIVSHDTTADRCTNGTGSFKTMTLAQARALDAGIRFDSRFAGERIPTLHELIDVIEKTNICLSIEIKGDTSDEFRATAQATVKLLQDRRFLQNASIASFDRECLRAVREWEPLLTTNLDPTPQDGSLTPWELCQQCLRCGANFMGYNYERLTAAHIDEARKHGLAFWAWTINDEAAMRRVAAMGVDAILSDDAVMLQAVLGAAR
jgi:glycerophosphoryl diester phosphodiesterase